MSVCVCLCCYIHWLSGDVYYIRTHIHTCYTGYSKSEFVVSITASRSHCVYVCVNTNLSLRGKSLSPCRGLSRNAVNCPSHPTVPWDHGITWDCPSYPTAPWDFPQDVHLSLYRCMCPSHPTVPWDRGTFHGMSTCPSH